jgi:hypothetical protein
MNKQRPVSKIILYCFVGSFLFAPGCGFPPLADQSATIEAPHSSKSPQQNEAPMPTGIFDNDSKGKEAWQRFTEDGRYRVARAKDFNIPEAAMASTEHRYDIERAIEFAYVGEDINRDGLYKDRAFIVVDTTRTDPAKFGLVIFNELRDKTSLTEPYWVYREKDLSRAVMSWASGELILVTYHDDGRYDLCRIKWDGRQQRYSCE